MADTSETFQDHCYLEHLNDATLLHNSKQRFKADLIYTYISEILLVLNPFKTVTPANGPKDLYGEEMMARYKDAPRTKRDPHIFAVAEMSFVHMRESKQSQSLLVAGESGAGKTETNKHLMHFLIWRAGTAAGREHLSEDILRTNPVLESLGNAKTIGNNNSSRFGKYLVIKFDRDHKVLGAEVRTFLLEKSRVTNASGRNERSYHIFYQLLKGSQVEGGHGAACLKGKTGRLCVHVA